MCHRPILILPVRRIKGEVGGQVPRLSKSAARHLRPEMRTKRGTFGSIQGAKGDNCLPHTHLYGIMERSTVRLLRGRLLARFVLAREGHRFAGCLQLMQPLSRSRRKAFHDLICFTLSDFHQPLCEFPLRRRARPPFQPASSHLLWVICGRACLETRALFRQEEGSQGTRRSHRPRFPLPGGVACTWSSRFGAQSVRLVSTSQEHGSG
jgi:hypothetical protein